MRDLVVEDSVFSRTAGTDPQAGVDIEPSLDYFNESNITFTRCSFLYNTGSAFKISAGRLLNTSSFTLLVEDGTFIGGSMGSAGITMSFSGAKGSVVFRGGIVGPTVGPGLLLEDHTVGSAVAIFDRVQLIGVSTNHCGFDHLYHHIASRSNIAGLMLACHCRQTPARSCRIWYLLRRIHILSQNPSFTTVFGSIV